MQAFSSPHRPTSWRLMVVALAAVLALVLPAGAAFADPGPSVAPPTRLFDTNDGLVPPGAVPSGPVGIAASSGDYRIDALVSGYKLAGTTVTFSFYSDAVFGGAYYGTETGVHEVSGAVKANTRAALAWYGSIMNMTFTEVPETAASIGVIRIMDSAIADYAHAYYPTGGATLFSVGSDVHLNSTYDRLGDTNGFQHPAGMHGNAAIIHEIGHALGLKHPFDTNFPSGPNVLPTAEDNDSNTIMSYTFSNGAPGTPMVYDVLALQYLYGARPKAAGDDVYRFTSRGTSQFTVGGVTSLETPYQTKQVLWDSAGIDTIDASGLPATSSGYRFDLRGGGWLSGRAQYLVNALAYGTALAPTFEPEGFINSSSNDTVYANGSANTFGGYTAGRNVGNDTIIGATSPDVVDLSAYTLTAVSSTTSGTDLVLGLGGRGSVTVAGYFAGDTPAIRYAGNLPPIAVASVAASGGKAAFTASFSAAGSSDPDGSIVGYAWDFGDGTLGSGASVSHTYTGPGAYTATLTVTDSDGATAFDTVLITVTPNAAPVARDDSARTDEDAPLSVGAPGVLANDSDPDGDAIQAAAVREPGHGTLRLDPNGAYTYTPDPGWHGTDTFSYRAFDGQAYSPSVTVTIEVSPVNHAPVASAQSASVDENTGLTVDAPGVLSNGSDTDGDTLTALLATAPAHGSVDLNADGSYSYAPAAGFIGVDTFTFRASDGRASSAPAVVTITVAAIAHAPGLTIVSGSPTLAGYGASYTLRGTIESADQQDVATVILQSARVGAPFTDTDLRVAPTAGTFSFVVAPQYTTLYRVRVEGGSALLEGSSGSVTVTPRAWVRTPVAPSKMSHSRTSTVYGYLKPGAVTGSTPVRVYRYRYVGRHWRSYGYVTARASDYAAYSKYSLKLRLGLKGRWRIRAYAPADAVRGYAAAWSAGYDYVTVR